MTAALEQEKVTAEAALDEELAKEMCNELEVSAQRQTRRDTTFGHEQSCFAYLRNSSEVAANLKKTLPWGCLQAAFVGERVWCEHEFWAVCQGCGRPGVGWSRAFVFLRGIVVLPDTSFLHFDHRLVGWSMDSTQPTPTSPTLK